MNAAVVPVRVSLKRGITLRGETDANPDVIAACRRYSKPIICGAYTPTEMLAAHEAGADFIKLFPADTLGPAYIRFRRYRSGENRRNGRTSSSAIGVRASQSLSAASGMRPAY